MEEKKAKRRRKRKQEEEVEKEGDMDSYDNWCFVCKDGGDLILCDHRDCPYVYHPKCVGVDDSVLESDQSWICARHSCLTCNKTPKFFCFCCPFALCGTCTASADVLPIRGRKGLCDDCFELVLAVDADEGFDADGNKIDIADRDTMEGLFLEYWVIVKEKERLSLNDVYLAEGRVKKGQFSECSSKSKKIVKQKKRSKLMSSDDDWDESDESDAMGKRKGPQASVYMGWGSKPLIDFLRSLGNDTTKEMLLEDVESIIYDYVQNNKLFDPKNGKKILCDERLYLLFRKRTIVKKNIQDLLEIHFASNSDKPEEDKYRNEVEVNSLGEYKKPKISRTKWWNKVGHSLPGENETAMMPHEVTRMANSDRKSRKVGTDYKFQQSCFAAIVPENIKLVYLRRSLVEEFLNEPDTLEAKVVGCFVKVKNCSRDFHSSANQLLQVTCVKNILPSADCQSEILFTLYGSPTDVRISMLSDLSLKEEEVVDLREKIEKGLHPRPTIVELEQKAKYLHEDITNHWIKKELVGLQRLIDFTNVKGWRGELEKHLEEKEQLEKPSEQERLLKQIPKVIAEIVKCGSGSGELSGSDSEK